MRKYIVIISVLAFLLAAPLALAGGNFGQLGSAGKLVSLGKDEVIERDYFAAGEMVEISGTVEGDVYAAGGEVLVDGVVEGDLLVMGGNVTVSGDVVQDIRVVGGNVTISGEVGGNVTAVGGNIDLTNTANVTGSLVGAGGNVKLASFVGSNVKLAAGNATVSSQIDGFLHVRGDSVRLTSKAAVNGDLVYWSYQDASIDEQAVVAGEVTKHIAKKPEVPKEDMLKFLLGVKLFFRFVGLISALVLGFLLVSFYPNYSRRAAENIQTRPWAALGLGLLALIVTPIIVAVLMVTVVGVPLAFVLLASYFIYISLAKIFVMLLLGYWILKSFMKDAGLGWSLLAGAIVFYLLTLIPILGGLIAFVALLLGLGTTLITSKEVYHEAKKHKIV
jgi:cytoskeletal protein CcmA (bactofilin family)